VKIEGLSLNHLRRHLKEPSFRFNNRKTADLFGLPVARGQMKYLIPVFVGVATITAAVTTTLAQTHGAFNGRVPLTPYLYGYGAVILLVIAAAMAANAAKREELPPSQLHSERTVKQEANSQQNVYIGGELLREARDRSKAEQHKQEQPEQPTPLLELFDSKPMLIMYNGGGWYEVDPSNPHLIDNKPNAFVAIFRNRPAPRGETPSIYGVTAHLIYRNSKCERMAVDSGTWLQEYTHLADFRAGKSHGLVLSSGTRAGKKPDGKVYVFDNPYSSDPRRPRFRSGPTVIHAPKEKPIFPDCCELEISLVANNVTVYYGAFKCSLNPDGTMKDFDSQISDDSGPPPQRSTVGVEKVTEISG